MRLYEFYDFIVEKEVLKLPIKLSDRLIVVLKQIDSKVSKKLLKYHNDSELSQYTLIDTDYDGTDQVSFKTTKSIVDYFKSKNIESSEEIKDFIKGVNPGSEFWIKNRNKIKVGRLIKSLFDSDFSDKEIENFVNQFKSNNEESKTKFEIVKGNEISITYKSSNFSKIYGRSNSLWNSCMNNEDYIVFRLYIDNPEVCSMLVMYEFEIDEESGTELKKIIGRALLWKTDKGNYMDRVYYCQDKDYFSFVNWAKKNNYFYKKENKSSSAMLEEDSLVVIKNNKEVSLKLSVELSSDLNVYQAMPYLDTFVYGKKINEKSYLFNYSVRPDRDSGVWVLDDTCGDYVVVPYTD